MIVILNIHSNHYPMKDYSEKSNVHKYSFDKSVFLKPSRKIKILFSRSMHTILDNTSVSQMMVTEQ
jgi:hypothetical protein